MSNYGVYNITGTLLVSGSMDKGFLLLGQFFFLDRSLDRICLYFWIRSYSTWEYMYLSGWDFHFWISGSWHILDTLSLHWLLHLKFKRNHYQLVFPPRNSLLHGKSFFGTYYRILTHCWWQHRSRSRGPRNSERKWLQLLSLKTPDGDTGQEYLTGYYYGKCSYQHIECTSSDVGG